MSPYLVIYDGTCNLCVTLVQFLEQLDQGQKFVYLPMQDPRCLTQFAITPASCEMGMYLLDLSHPDIRWQGADAAEEIGRLLPLGSLFVDLYRRLPGLKTVGDNVYGLVRDTRYAVWGKREEIYMSAKGLKF